MLPDLLPHRAKKLFNRGVRFYEQGQLRRAKEAFESCYQGLQVLINQGRAEFQPNLAHTRMNLGNCLLQLGDLPAVRQAYPSAVLIHYDKVI